MPSIEPLAKEFYDTYVKTRISDGVSPKTFMAWENLPNCLRLAYMAGIARVVFVMLPKADNEVNIRERED